MDDSFYDEDIFDVQTITNDFLSDLIEIWRHMFNRETTKVHLNRLKQFTRDYYNDVVQESLQRQKQMEDSIPELANEVQTLSKQLNIPVQMPARDLSLYEIEQQLKEKVELLRAELIEKQNELRQLIAQQISLCDELGEEPLELTLDPLPSESALAKFCDNLDWLKREREHRSKRLVALRRQVNGYLKALELTVSNPIEERLLHTADVVLNEHTFKTLEQACQRYAAKVQEVREQIDAMRRKLDKLWNRLGTGPETRSKFDKYSEYTQQTYEALYMEVKRCEALKSQNIKHYLEELRKEIRVMWEKTYMSELQRKQFVKFNSTCYTDDLIELHEMELHDLKTYYEDNRRIFELYAKRCELWQRMLALDVRDPSRYTNRGGTLLKEEKERKMLANKLPKIEDELKQLVKEYEQHTHKPFHIQGENILSVIARDWERKRFNKPLLPQSARSGGNTYRTSRTPLTAWNTPTTTARSSKLISNSSLVVVTKTRTDVPTSTRLTKISSSIDCRLYCASVVATPDNGKLRLLATPTNCHLKNNFENLHSSSSRTARSSHWSRRPQC